MQLDSAWKNEGNKLSRQWKFKNFRQALAWVNAVGAVAEELKHHPDISFGWGYVNINLTTHDAGHSLTDKDLQLAVRIDQLAST